MILAFTISNQTREEWFFANHSVVKKAALLLHCRSFKMIEWFVSEPAPGFIVITPC